jgi:formylglycine-generating enzyme required for sulfatase activity
MVNRKGCDVAVAKRTSHRVLNRDLRIRKHQNNIKKQERIMNNVKLVFILTYICLLLMSCSVDNNSTKPNVNNAPDELELISPLNNSVDVSINTSLSWNCRDSDGDNLTYDIYFGTNVNPLLLENDYSPTIFVPNAFEGNTQYWWKIVASDSEYETEGSVWTFTTGNAPEPVEMIFVQGGTFLMGDHFNEGQNDELPTHNVTVSSFYIGQYEVTQLQYESVMGNNPSYNYGVGDDNPVYYVSWYDAVEYCNALSEQEGFTPCYNLSTFECNFSANGYRLPTEAEWEYAARGGINNLDNYKYSGTTGNLGDYAWYLSNSAYQTYEVGTKLPNQLSIYDMSGNVWEWCNDWYHPDFYDVSPSDNPTGPNNGTARVIRGGSRANNPEVCRVANRLNNGTINSGGRNIGFRILKVYE